jgi:hypothetical protein
VIRTTVLATSPATGAPALPRVRAARDPRCPSCPVGQDIRYTHGDAPAYDIRH